MLESLQNENLEYQKLSQDEQQRRGILGRLVGIVADFMAPTRNGRHYSEELWEKVFDDPIMKERIENGVCFGELCHPTDREETDMEKVAVCMPEVPKKNKDGKLTAVFDILDTPNGRILKTLCDYGSTLGVSSRGSGDTFMGKDGNEEVDPDSYTCQGFDIVLIPAVKSARLQYVTESLNNKKSLRESLQDIVNNASDEDKKVMEETIDNLKLEESESLNEKLNPYDLDLVIKKMKAYLEEWEEVHDKDYSEAWVSPEEIKNLEKVASYLHIIENERPDLLEDIENSDASLDIDEVTDDGAVVDDEAIFEELQTVLKQRQEAEQKVIELNEKLSVCYAKEESVNNRVTSLKAQIEKLTESSNQATALKTKVSKLEEDLNLKEQELEKLNKRISTNVNARKALTEDVNSKQDVITKLNEELKTSSDTIQSLTTQVEDLKKDLQLNKNSYSKKLEKSNQLVENYKKITTNVVNRYIESQALKLGISSNEIKNKLPESYNIDDIDAICEDLQSYKLNMSKLPFSTMQSVKVTPKSIKTESLLPKGAEDDFVDAQLLSLLEKK